jgi:hypothetical protein
MKTLRYFVHEVDIARVSFELAVKPWWIVVRVYVRATKKMWRFFSGAVVVAWMDALSV